MIPVSISIDIDVRSSFEIIIMDFMKFKQSFQMLLISHSNCWLIFVPRKSFIDVPSIFVLLFISSNCEIILISTSFVVSSIPFLLLSINFTSNELKISISAKYF